MLCCGSYTYPIAQPNLEDIAVLIYQLGTVPRVVFTQQQQAAKDGDTGKFWESFYLGYICSVGALYSEAYDGDSSEKHTNCRIHVDEYLPPQMMVFNTDETRIKYGKLVQNGFREIKSVTTL